MQEQYCVTFRSCLSHCVSCFMSGWSRKPLFLVTLLPLLILVTTLYAAESDRKPILLKLGKGEIQAAGIEVAKVTPETGMTEATLQGVVQAPPRQVRVVAAPAGGLIETVLIDPDEMVQQGQPIAILRSTELVEAQRLYLEAEAGATLAEERLTRDEAMFREHIIPERRLLTTRAEASFARSRLDERLQMLSLLGMDAANIAVLKKNRTISPTLTIIAPVSGTVLQRQSMAGERVAQAAPLFTIAHLNPLWVHLQVPLARAASLAPGNKVSVSTFGGQGQVIRVGRSVDPTTQATSATAEITQGTEGLRPGQAVTVSVQLEQSGMPQWRVPVGAVIRHHNHNWVFVQTEGGFRAQPVTVIGETSTYTSIRGHLSVQDNVAVEGMLPLLAELTKADGS
ncbi:efflux RND transporter periplasmic adaptor subunit [Granulibacter bethesdensis]|uniref:Cobalt-zinc-cadmium resistance protein czcB n=1 Tax=Granulibacter bethesdensis (strain ATCC BAA-1260 / CGDNIH1) TaxID=391165 RepID=Q0BSN3_GRABC|nr:Cobalt-zinc-cadmium resistance protein czcB [Granulibacter bethesdensis CGDNIH1]AHJ68926.1 Cobalt-zinc-cadmium resistance protein czcB [Granulibacter bethesdensis]APH51996.1 Cobalt-zinc-cadmium resistance protein czcB [Granulibacter bethesdensis]APH64686.1 Cobalt-zinc-cadmium resistance protein czcB [Granulibacter bethesdensis]